MGLLWGFVAIAVAIVWVATIVDIFRRHYTGWTIAGWIALVVILPFIGSAIYWARRPPTRDEVEQERLAQMALHDSAATRRFDSTGTAR
jgi:hypothetical protein